MPRGKRATYSSEPLPPRRGRKRQQPTSAAAGLPDELDTQSVQEQSPRGRRRRKAATETIDQEPAQPAVAESEPETTPAESVARPTLPSEDASSPAMDTGAQDPTLVAAEADLVRRYPDCRIKPGSLRAAGAAGFGHKRTVVLLCRCGAERVVATSDLFHVSMCAPCTKAAKKDSRQAKKQPTTK